MDTSPLENPPTSEKNLSQEFNRLQEEAGRAKEELAEMKTSLEAENMQSEALLASLKHRGPPFPGTPSAD